MSVTTWEQSVLSNEEQTILAAKDIKNLLLHRKVSEDNIPTNKDEMIAILKTKPLKLHDLESLSVHDLNIELKIFNVKMEKQYKYKGILLFLLQLKYNNDDVDGWMQINKSHHASHSNLIKFDRDSFICSTDKECCKYNTKTKQWIVLFEYKDTDNMKNQLFSCLNKNQHKFYILCDDKLVSIHYQEQEVEHTPRVNLKQMNGKMININNELHLFVIIEQDIRQYIRGENQAPLTLLHKLSEIAKGEKFTQFEIVCNSSNDKAYLIANGKCFIYTVNDDKWQQLTNVAIPEIGLYKSEITTNEELIVFMSRTLGKIYYLDLNNLVFKETKIVCPKIIDVNIIIYEEKEEKDLLIHGFIRELWRNHFLSWDSFPPKYLIKHCGVFCHHDVLAVLLSFQIQTILSY